MTDENCKSCNRETTHLPQGHEGYLVIKRLADDVHFAEAKEYLIGKACARCWMPVAAAARMDELLSDCGLGSHLPSQYIELDYTQGVLLHERINSLEWLVDDQAQQLRYSAANRRRLALRK